MLGQYIFFGQGNNYKLDDLEIDLHFGDWGDCKMFTKKTYEHCNVYYNPYEDIEILKKDIAEQERLIEYWTGDMKWI